MNRWGHLVLLPWALWAQVETHTIPSHGAPYVHVDVVQRFRSYEACDEAARWAESQPDMREDFLIQNGQRYRSTMRYECRQGEAQP